MKLKSRYTLYAVTLTSFDGNEREIEAITEFDQMPSDVEISEAFEQFASSTLKATFDFLTVEKQWYRIY